jgi:hypothetical protein
VPIPADYVDVAQRVQQFYEKYPDGSLQSWQPPYVETIGDKPFLVYSAAAYRTPDDPRPAIGWAWEPVPGPTNFTRDSELMNAETAAWGRAIAALGFATKHIASADEVRSAQDKQGAAPAAANGGGPAMSDAQKRKLHVVIGKLETAGALTRAKVEQGCQKDYGHGLDDLTKSQASQLIERLEKFEKDQVAA